MIHFIFFFFLQGIKIYKVMIKMCMYTETVNPVYITHYWCSELLILVGSPKLISNT